MMKCKHIFLVFTFFLLACADDEAPDLTEYEPFVTIGFYDTADNTVVTALDQVSVVGYSNLFFETAAAKYQLPLDINASQSAFVITIGGVDTNLTVDYIPTVENQVNVLRFLMENTTVSSHSYDSVKVICELNCISNETEIKIYR